MMMVKKKWIKWMGATVAACLSVLFVPNVSRADNPIIQNVYTADPAPMVYGDTLYIYTSHDEDELIDGFYTMDDWKCYSTKDMVNWTDHGTVLSYSTFEWAKKNSAWAGQCVERDGKFYYYVPLNDKNGATVIGVAVGDSPTGPFSDPIGAPLVKGGSGNIDPTVFVDDDGQAYLYWGNPDLKCVKLKDNMIETDGDITIWKLLDDKMTDEHKADMQQQFGVTNDPKRRPTLYEEGPWFYKRGDLYYMVYASNGIPERVDYSTSESPMGPWTYRGMIMNSQYNGNGSGSFTNHPGIADFMGHSYFFYHTGKLPGGGGFNRSVAVEEFVYNEDGTIPEIPFTDAGVEAIENLNPYERVEAETLAWGNGLESEECSQGGRNLCSIEDGDYLKVKDVDFGSLGSVAFTASVADNLQEVAAIELHLDGKNGEIIGTLSLENAEESDVFKEYTTEVENVSGIHDLYMVFKGGEGELFKFDYWKFTEKTIPVESISLSSDRISLQVGQSVVLSATVAPENATNQEICFMSDNSEVATVDAMGRVEALKPGNATIVAKTQDGTELQAVCHVNVEAVPTPTSTPIILLPTPTPTVTPSTSVVVTSSPSPAPKKDISVAKGKIKSIKWKKKNQAKVLMGKVQGAAGYEVMYSQNKKFKTKKKVMTKKTTLVLKRLKKGTYYVKVRAYKMGADGKKVYGAFSNTKKLFSNR